LKVAIGTIVKDEADSLIEWVAYHLAIGIDHFIIADNESVDSTPEILGALARLGLVTFFGFPTPMGGRPQIPAFNKILDEYCVGFDLVGFIDVDEFIVPLDGQSTIRPLLESSFRSEDVMALALNWCNFGSSRHIFREPGLVIERFLYRAHDNFLANHHYKSFLRVGAGGFTNPHHVNLNNGRYLDAAGEDLVVHHSKGPGLSERVVWGRARLNHYVVKSLQEYFVGKANRGNASTARAVNRKSYFLGHDRNDVFDDSALIFCDSLRARIDELRLSIKKINSCVSEKLFDNFDFSSCILDGVLWHFDSPNRISLKPEVGKILKLSGWVVDRNHGRDLGVAIEQQGIVRRFSRNVNRPDVVRKVLDGCSNTDLVGFVLSVEYLPGTNLSFFSGGFRTEWLSLDSLYS